MNGNATVVDWEAKKNQWVRQVTELMEQIKGWVEKEPGWGAAPFQKEMEEQALGTYSLPALQLRTPQGNLFVTPVARNVVGAEGRVDLEGFPSLNRLLLILNQGRWQVATDSGVVLPLEWSSETFMKLARELTR
jgi:hypothetical protein